MKRPLSVTIIGVIGVLWGFVGTVGGIAVLFLLMMSDRFTDWLRLIASPDMLNALKDPDLRRWNYILLVVQTGLNALLFFGAVCLLRLQPKGWWMVMGYAAAALLWAVADRVILDRTVYETFRQRYKMERTERPRFRLMLGLLYPVLASYFLTRPRIMALYKQIETERLILTGDPEHDNRLIERAGAVIRKGGLVAFPTETVYGLGADALNPKAVQRIFEAKERPTWDPLIVHVGDVEQLRKVVKAMPPTAERLAQTLMPGPLTLVLPKADCIPDLVTAGRPTVAVRIPTHPVALALIRASGTPIAAPSANRFGRPSPTTADHVMADLEGRIEIVLDAGASPVGVESTVLDLTTEPPVILRPGGVPREAIEAIIGSVRLLEEAFPEGQPLPSPGTSPRHYAPRVPVLLCPPEPDALFQAASDALNLYERIGVMAPDGWQLPPSMRLVRFDWGEWGDWQQLARRLFEGLRALEAEEVDAILCPLPPASELALALRDRLLRAAQQG